MSIWIRYKNLLVLAQLVLNIVTRIYRGVCISNSVPKVTRRSRTHNPEYLNTSEVTAINSVHARPIRNSII